MRVWVRVHMLDVKARGQRWVLFLTYSLSCFLIQGLRLAWSSPSRRGQWGRGSYLPPLSPVLGLQTHHNTFIWASGDGTQVPMFTWHVPDVLNHPFIPDELIHNGKIHSLPKHFIWFKHEFIFTLKKLVCMHGRDFYSYKQNDPEGYTSGKISNKSRNYYKLETSVPQSVSKWRHAYQD